MTTVGGVPVSGRAKRLVEALHELHGNEPQWMVVQAFLDEERQEGWEAHKERLLYGYRPCYHNWEGHVCDKESGHEGNHRCRECVEFEFVGLTAQGV